MRREKTNYVIQSVAHAFDVLEQFRGESDELGVTELSRRLKLHKNNVFRLLATLESRGYIEQNKATENYRLGLRCLELGQTFLGQMGLLRQAAPVLESVAEKSGENTLLAVMRRRTAVPVTVVESRQPVRITSNVGETLPLHATAVGKAFLAHDPEEDLAALVGAKPERLTPTTIVDLTELVGHLATVAERGYAVELGETLADVHSVAAPIRDYTRNVVGALAVSGPAYRMGKDRIERELAPLVVGSARELSARLGYGEG